MGIMKTINVVAGIIEYNGLILCTQRQDNADKTIALKWEFPGGKIEEGESKESALKREIIEELNISIKDLQPFCDVEYCYPNKLVKMYCYVCKCNSNKITLNVHNDYKWLKKEDLESLEWAPADVPVVKKLLEKIKNLR